MSLEREVAYEENGRLGQELAASRAREQTLQAEVERLHQDAERFYCSHCACPTCEALAREDGGE